MPCLPSLTALRAFEAAARLENFRLAAEELHVSHGAVAQQIRGLEADLGVNLFQRLPRGVRLSQAGEAYLPPVQDALGILSRATGELRSGAGGKTKVSLSVTPSFASCWLMARFSSFAGACPDIDLRLAASELKVDLRSGEADLAIRQAAPPFGPGLSHVQLLPGDSVIVAAPGLMARLRAPDDLLSVPLLHDGHARWPEYFRDQLGAIPAKVETGLRFNQTAMSIKLAVEGKGVALVPRVLVAEELADGRLLRFSGPAPADGAGFYLVWPGVRTGDTGPARVRSWLQEAAALTLSG